MRPSAYRAHLPERTQCGCASISAVEDLKNKRREEAASMLWNNFVSTSTRHRLVHASTGTVQRRMLLLVSIVVAPVTVTRTPDDDENDQPRC